MDLTIRQSYSGTANATVMHTSLSAAAAIGPAATTGQAAPDETGGYVPADGEKQQLNSPRPETA